MATPTTYGPYDVGDLQNDQVNLGQLQREIEADPDIAIGVQGITAIGGTASSQGVITGGEFSITFKDVLPSDQKEAWDGSTSQDPENPPGAGSCLALHDAQPDLPQSEEVTLSSPSTSDGKPIFTQAVFRGDQNVVYAGAADNDAAGTRCDGMPFLVQQIEDSDGTAHAYEWSFIDVIYIFAGECEVFNGAAGDHVTFDLVSPATDVVENLAGTGNCNLVALGGGANAIVPAAGDGAYDVDLTEAVNPNLADKPKGHPHKVTKAVPVPAFDDDDEPNGYWDWDETTGAITASATPGSAYWNLLDFEANLTRWVTRLQLWTPSATEGIGYRMEVPTKAKKALPHWKFRVSVVTTDDQRTVTLTWFLILGRKVTT